jgi:hypothetical protein
MTTSSQLHLSIGARRLTRSRKAIRILQYEVFGFCWSDRTRPFDSHDALHKKTAEVQSGFLAHRSSSGKHRATVGEFAQGLPGITAPLRDWAACALQPSAAGQPSSCNRSGSFEFANNIRRFFSRLNLSGLRA